MTPAEFAPRDFWDAYPDADFITERPDPQERWPQFLARLRAEEVPQADSLFWFLASEIACDYDTEEADIIVDRLYTAAKDVEAVIDAFERKRVVAP